MKKPFYKPVFLLFMGLFCLTGNAFPNLNPHDGEKKIVKKLINPIYLQDLNKNKSNKIDEEIDQALINKVYKYMRDNLMFKTLVFKDSLTLDDGKLETDIENRKIFSDLVRTKRGLKFIQTFHINQMLYKMENGQRVLPGQNVNRYGTQDFNLAVKTSSGKLIGTSNILSLTGAGSDGTGISASLRIYFEGDNLVIRDNTSLYDDFFSAEGRLSTKPGAADCKHTYQPLGGKIANIMDCVVSWVDPTTLERTPWRDEDGNILVWREIYKQE